MIPPLKLTLLCFSVLILFRCASSDELQKFRWTCICHPGSVEALKKSSNCSAPCVCTLDIRGQERESWNCSCVSEDSSRVPSVIQDGNCFTSCKCTPDFAEIPPEGKKFISEKGLVAVLLLCVVFTITVLFTSVACYFYHKDKCSARPALPSSVKGTNWNTVANSTSNQSASTQGFYVNTSFYPRPIIGIVRKLSFIFGREKGGLPGAITRFAFVELEQATNRFSNTNLVGLGGSSNVYRGELNGVGAVAIKKLKAIGDDYEFLTEIELLSRLNHCHVVPLLGYCLESLGKQSERLLVFEYMCNGSLRDCLDAQATKPMDWGTRVTIAIGAAKGLEYLHEAAAPRILHRDIKSTNILLDDKFRAKITDLGMAKRLMPDDAVASCTNSPSRMLGTFGYFAPEYAIVGKASLKSDVFSFGVVVLELITGRQPIQKIGNGDDESLVMWAAARLRNSRLVVTELPDPLLKGKFPEEEMQIMAHLARECLQWDPESRPTMSEVVQILSVIAPDKTKKKNLPDDIIFMTSSTEIMKKVAEIESSEGCRVETIKGNSSAVSVGCNACCSTASLLSLPSRTEDDDTQNEEDMIVCQEYLEGLMMIQSSRRVSDAEIVDSYEPRFELFLQPL
ncbi:Non-specific serine/threonine protein kinase protein [Dioscorea alata]|nr:Non-specific serine/threonine protein kinase protein [Dioscorea alata]KAH7669851.1 Non-specific serine/threonine protein kinase protein [Dioscorea alata]KAH7669856.1 Non-specific serine/threonine protein kinase protein [Dioscorea alata]